ncbi:hypothetical protein [Enhygromyxa salina]|uniref:hypothetical protein n=1 Tax=Enhygromyxa salina TaxID=215803 RepID=UPI000D093018|nr:hypothetical protein [Enhygromyxa salina]
MLDRKYIAPLVVFLVALLGLCALAGRERLTKPSHDNHYAHLAQAWLDGRLHHEGKPPGYCSPKQRRAKKCRRHTYDDWARVWTLELRDGSTLKGFPCKTKDCQALRRRGVEAWLPLGLDHSLREIESRDIVSRHETWYVSFPPGPALAMLPAVAIHGTAARDVLLTCVLAALIPVVLLRLFDRERGITGGRGREHLWAVAAWTFASPAAFVGAHGRVWFTAQICGALCLCAYVSSGWNCRRPALAGLWLALAVTCRPHLAFALPFFVGEWWREQKGSRARLNAALRFAAPLAIIGALVMANNYARFEDPLEFGHRFLDIRWQQRMQEVGMFSTDYLGRNLRCAFSLLPVWRDGPWDGRLPRVSVHGSSLILGAPWLLALGLGRERCPQRWGLLISALAVALPSLLYQNSGQLQFSYRFAVDWLALVLIAIVFGGGAKRPWFPILVTLGAAWQLYGAWMFGRRPGQLFVTDPPSWPFENELE